MFICYTEEQMIEVRIIFRGVMVRVYIDVRFSMSHGSVTWFVGVIVGSIDGIMIAFVLNDGVFDRIL